MRDSFLDCIYEEMQQNEKIVMLTGDLGFGLVERFRDNFPKRFYNAGISEQSMMSMAAGLALEGKKVFIYSIGNFPTFRCLEQIRNDVAYHNCDVNIICVGAGFAYGALGMSHHATEDIAVIRAIPGIDVLCPADPCEAAAAARYCINQNTPKYIRLNKKGEEPLYPMVQSIEEGIIERKYSSNSIALLSTGAIAEEAGQALEVLQNANIPISFYTVPLIKPLNIDALYQIANNSKAILTIEEGNIGGGFGSTILEALSDAEVIVPIIRLGIKDCLLSIVGDQKYLRKQCGIDARSIASKCIEIWESVK